MESQLDGKIFDGWVLHGINKDIQGGGSVDFNFTFLVVDHRYYVKGCVEFYPVGPLLFKVLCNALVVEISPIRELDWWRSYMYKE